MKLPHPLILLAFTVLLVFVVVDLWRGVSTGDWNW